MIELEDLEQLAEGVAQKHAEVHARLKAIKLRFITELTAVHDKDGAETHVYNALLTFSHEAKKMLTLVSDKLDKLLQVSKISKLFLEKDVRAPASSPLYAAHYKNILYEEGDFDALHAQNTRVVEIRNQFAYLNEVDDDDDDNDDYYFNSSSGGGQQRIGQLGLYGESAVFGNVFQNSYRQYEHKLVFQPQYYHMIDFKGFSDRIAQCHGLREIIINSDPYHMPPALKNLPASVRSVSLLMPEERNPPVNDEDIQNTLTCLSEQDVNLVSFSFCIAEVGMRNADITDHSMHCLSEFLVQLCNLQHLDLNLECLGQSNHNITDVSLGELGHGLKALRNLHTLSLNIAYLSHSNEKVTLRGVRGLCAGLSSFEQIHTLKFNATGLGQFNKYISDEAAIEFGKAICQLSTLKSLDLRCGRWGGGQSYIKDQAFEYLVENIAMELYNLEELYLDFSEWGYLNPCITNRSYEKVQDYFAPIIKDRVKVFTLILTNWHFNEMLTASAASSMVQALVKCAPNMHHFEVRIGRQQNMAQDIKDLLLKTNAIMTEKADRAKRASHMVRVLRANKTPQNYRREVIWEAVELCLL